MRYTGTDRLRGKLLRTGLSFVFLGSMLFADVPDALAYRSSAGGGDHAEVDWGEIGMSAGISIGGAVLGAVAGSAWSSAKGATDATTKIGRTAQTVGNLFTSTDHISKGFTSMLKYEKIFSTVAKGYTAYMATTQVSRALGAAGAYYGWEADDTYLFTSIANAGVTGFLNPSASLGDAGSVASTDFTNRMAGMLVGGASGAASGATIIGIDGDKIRKGENPGIGAQIAGTASGIAATEIGRAIVDPSTYKITEQKYEIKTKPVLQPDGTFRDVEYVYRAGESTPLMDRAHYADQTGVTATNKNLDYMGASLGAGVLDEGATARVVTSDGSAGAVLRTGLSDTQLLIQDHTFPGDSAKTFYGPNMELSYGGDVSLVKPTFGQVLGRITVGALKNTLDQWPTVAGTAAALYATEDMDPNWKPLVYTVVSSTTSPILDSAATVWRLKPSLWGTKDSNLDTMLGKRPALMEQRQMMADRALRVKISRELKDLDLSDTVNVGDLKKKLSDLEPTSRDKIQKMSDSEILALAASKHLFSADALIPQTFKGMFSASEKNEILSNFIGRMGSAATVGDAFNDKVAKENIYDSLTGVFSRRKADGGVQSWDLYKEAGGTRLGVFGIAGENILRYDLPVATLSGLINVGFNHALIAAGADKDVMDTQVGTLMGLTAASIARGTVGWAYKNYLDKRELKSIQGGQYDQMVTSTLNYRDPAEIVIARFEGDLPMPQKTILTSSVYKDDKGVELGEKDIQERFNRAQQELKGYGINIPNEEIDLSKTDVESARLKVVSYVNAYNRNLELLKKAPGTGESGDSMLVPLKNEFVEGANVKPLDMATASALLAPLQNVIELNTIRPAAEGEAGPIHIYAQNSAFANVDYVVSHMDQDGKVISTRRVDNLGERGLSMSDTLFTVKDGKLAEQKYFMLNGVPVDQQNVRVDVVSERVPLSAAIFGNLQQGIFEMGWQTLAMGLPATKGGKMSSYAWNSYRSYLNSVAISASRQGFFKTMREQNIDVMKGSETSSSGIIENFGVSIIGNTPFVNKAVAIAPYVPVAGYKGMPYSELVIVETGMNRARETFYPNWPYNAIRAIPSDQFARYLRFNLRASQINPAETAYQTDDRDLVTRPPSR